MRPISTWVPVPRFGNLGVSAAAITLCLLATPAQAETTDATGAAYASLCSARGVPLPPPFGGTNNVWTFSGELNQSQSFNHESTSNIYFFNDPQGKGACVADARRDINGSGKTDFFGVLCQSIHGKVCLWDQASSPSGNGSFNWPMTFGSSASIVSGAPAGRMRVNGLNSMTADNVGRSLMLSTVKSQNSGTFLIVNVNSSTSVDVVNGVASPPDTASSWTFGKLAVPTSGTGPGGSIYITSTTQSTIPTSGPRWSGGADLRSGGPNGGAGMCTDCHAGENIFINHPGSAVDMWSSFRPTNVPTPAIPTASWFPDNWPDPIVPRSDPNGSWPKNVGPATFVDSYPRSTAGLYSASTTGCVTCHTPDGRGSTGGRLASLRTFAAGQYFSEIVTQAATDPAFLSSCSASDISSGDILCPAGGMPPGTGGGGSDPFFARMSADGIQTTNLALNKTGLISSDLIGIGQAANAARATDGYSNANWFYPDGTTTDTITHSQNETASTLNNSYGGQWLTNTGAIQPAYGALTGIGQNNYALGTFGTSGAGVGRGMTYEYSFSTGGWILFAGDTFGGRTQISIGANNVLWGVAADSVCHSTSYTQWACVSGGFFQVAAGNGVNPWVIDTSKLGVYRMDNSGTWVSMIAGDWPGRTTNATLKQIAVGTDEDAWALDSHGVVIHWAGGGGWKQEQPYYGGNSQNVNAIALRNAQYVWASTSSGLYNFTPSFHDSPTDSQHRWQHHCPTGGCFSSNSQFVTVAVGLQDNSVYAVTSSGTGGLVYQVDESLVVNQHDSNSTDNSLVNLPNPSGVAFAQIAAVGGALGQQHGNIFATATNGTGYTNYNYAGKLPLSGAAWWYVDLGATYHVEQIKIYNRDDGVAGRLSNFRISYYTGLAWALGSDQSNTSMTSSNLALPINVNFDTRYVMVQKTTPDYLSLSEVEVYGPTTGVTQFSAIAGTGSAAQPQSTDPECPIVTIPSPVPTQSPLCLKKAPSGAPESVASQNKVGPTLVSPRSRGH